MLNNLQLVAYSSRGQSKTIEQIEIADSLQRTLNEEWGKQVSTFCDSIRELDFDAGYKPEPNERFKISGYKMPDDLNISREAINTLDVLKPSLNALKNLSAIIAFAQWNGKEIAIIQRFTASMIINPKWAIFARANTFETSSHIGIALGSKPDAVYFINESKLLFSNFRNTNGILSLANFYKEATEQEVREILSHKSLKVENIEVMSKDVSQWFRTRFSMLRDSRILEQFKPREIQATAKGYLDVEIEGDGEDEKLVFPSEKSAAKRLLQFLNEELYKGAITSTIYETNSKRAAD